MRCFSDKRITRHKRRDPRHERLLVNLHTSVRGERTAPRSCLPQKGLRKKSSTSQKRSQMAERLGNRVINQNIAGSIPGHAKWRCVLGQGTSPYLPQGKCPCNYCKSLWIRASAKWLIVEASVYEVWAILTFHLTNTWSCQSHHKHWCSIWICWLDANSQQSSET